MIRISRLTDYGIVLMSCMAARPDGVLNATEAAADAHLPLPTASKLLRVLAREGLLTSQRGVKGGYSLARSPEQISVASIISAIEGPIALTVCTVDPAGDCGLELVCPVRAPWQKINHAIRQALEGVSLAEMAALIRQQPPATDAPPTPRAAAAARGLVRLVNEGR